MPRKLAFPVLAPILLCLIGEARAEAAAENWLPRFASRRRGAVPDAVDGRPPARVGDSLLAEDGRWEAPALRKEGEESAKKLASSLLLAHLKV